MRYILICLLFCNSAFAAQFGNTEQEVTLARIDDRQRGTTGTTGAAGTLDSLYIYLTGSANVCRCAIYTGDLATLVDSTAEFTTTPDSWNQIVFVIGASVTATTNYTLWCWGDVNPTRMVSGAAVGFTYWTNSSEGYGGAWAEPISGGNEVADEAVSIYAVYTADAGADVGQVIIIGNK